MSDRAIGPGTGRWIVLYAGARMGYAVPALLARRGLLARFYTDLHAPSWRFLDRLAMAPMPRSIARLLGRRLPPELAGHVTSLPVAALADAVLPPLVRRGLGLGLHAPGAEEQLRARLLSDGFGDARGLYSLSAADLPVVRAAKERGLRVVHEQIISPHVGREVLAERRAFAGLEPIVPEAEIEAGIARDVEQWQLADLVLAPSEFVRDEVLSHGVDASRVRVVPYGVHEDWLQVEPAPEPGRLLFVGSVVLRKGVQYLAAASRLLRERGIVHRARVVGPVQRALRAHPAFAGLELAGQVPRARVREEFLRADLFVFPTLAEGCALVHLEALACGLPVVTTPACGSVVRDGVEGFIVPPRDPAALADRVARVLADRRLREDMSRAARARAREYTWARYADRLFAALGDR
jgi:glycosyltransferase involved in cell wall biosynthesis